MQKNVVLAGDFCLAGEECRAKLEHPRPDPWSGLRVVFGSDAAIVANLECPFTDRAGGLSIKWANLKTSPLLHWTLDGLSIAVLGNNHVADFGAERELETKVLLASKGIGSAGFGATLAESLRPAAAANERAATNVARHQEDLRNRSESVLWSRLRNGVLALGAGR